MAGRDITAQNLRSALDYDALTGLFYWRTAMRGVVKAGDLAGCLHHRGYWQIRFQGNSVWAHRLAWLHYYGSYPPDQIDHINGDKLDNRISNLRAADARLNTQNYRHAQSRKLSTDRLGVYKEPGKTFRARISVNGVNVGLGSYETVELAYDAYLRAKRKYHEGNTL